MGVQETIKEMHYPTTFEKQKQANLRIFFDRLLRIQLYSLRNRTAYQQQQTYMGGYDIEWDIIKDILSGLPFQLTNSKKST
ncbi:MAG: hypothetical protein WCH65_05575 [bacterium]